MAEKSLFDTWSPWYGGIREGFLEEGPMKEE